MNHPSQNPEPWRALLRENGFTVEEEGTPFTTLYFLAKKQGVARPMGVATNPSTRHARRF